MLELKSIENSFIDSANYFIEFLYYFFVENLNIQKYQNYGRFIVDFVTL